MVVVDWINSLETLYPPQNDSVSLRDKVTLDRREKWRILKNITTVSFAFMVQFTAFQVKC